MAQEQPVNILLVDDRAENLLALESILGDLGHNLVMASSGAEALKCLLKQDFAVILLDVQMPGLDGFETAELIHGRERSQNTPIIFLTALDRSDAGMFRGYSVGAVDFLFKPLVPEILRSKVSVFVDLFRKTKQIQQQAEQLEERVRERTAALTVANEALRAEIVERQRAEDTIRFLANATSVLASTLNYEHVLHKLAELAVPRLGSWCAVHMLDPKGVLRLIALHHSDPDLVKHGFALDEQFPHVPQSLTGPAHVAQTGEAELCSTISDKALRNYSHNDEHLAALQALELTSSMCVPLRVHERILGVMTFLVSGEQRSYSQADLQLAKELAHRAALAVENAMLYREAQQALSHRDDFLSIAAHELKTPITAIVGHVQLLQRRSEREGSLNERDQRSLRTLGDQALRLSRLIHAVLDISRLQVGQLSINHAPVELRALAQRVIDQMAQTDERHSIELMTPDEPVEIQGDELRLEQVLQNLVQNAVKYSPNGGVVRVEVRREHDQTAISVSDQGMGIPANALDQLFTCFYRAGNVEGTHISGMGVGLYVVKEIVTLHGGMVDVESVENEGSTFTIRLPQHQDVPLTAVEE